MQPTIISPTPQSTPGVQPQPSAPAPVPVAEAQPVTVVAAAPSGRNWMFMFGVSAIAISIVMVSSLFIIKKHSALAETTDVGGAQSIIIAVTDKNFTPSSVKVKSGTQITWHNSSSSTQQISIDSYKGKGPAPELTKGLQIEPDNEYTAQLEAAGTYKYSDPLHPDFKGEIIVK